MAVRKCKVRQWPIKLNEGRFSSPESLVWEIAARGEFAKLRETYFSAAYIDCSKCYEIVYHISAATVAVKTGSFKYTSPILKNIEANRGILAGRAYAVQYLKAMINEDVKDDNNELRDYVDDMVVLFKEGDTEEEAIRG
eukprot:4536461-Heterocapsa_arctica.AAC.1